ncbi:MAG: S-methyl-5-thioribose-1-phosphate isomerase [Nitrospinota bacterium]
MSERANALRPVAWMGEGVRLLDQRRLPGEEFYLECRDHRQVAEAIRSMAVRGAPAIGVAAAMGMALVAREYRGEEVEGLLSHLEGAAATLAATRPTARNLFWAIERMQAAARAGRGKGVGALREELARLAQAMVEEDVAICRRIGEAGVPLLPERSRVLTHCNAGALATAGYGTAGGIIRSGFREGKVVRVWVGETRPFLQGARLTAWEFQREGIPVTLITDSTAGYCMQRGEVDAVLVGADRIARNGDVANKVGTYTLAVLAREHGVPFYVAAPLSTVDFSLEDGSQIPIEERSPDEVRTLFGAPIAPAGVDAFNPAFDITPARLVDGLITEGGVVRPARGESLEELGDRVSAVSIERTGG